MSLKRCFFAENDDIVPLVQTLASCPSCGKILMKGHVAMEVNHDEK